jgi:hypothetical protein
MSDLLKAARLEREIGRILDRLQEAHKERDQARRYAEAMFPFWPAQKPLPWVKVDKTPEID